MKTPFKLRNIFKELKYAFNIFIKVLNYWEPHTIIIKKNKTQSIAILYITNYKYKLNILQFKKVINRIPLKDLDEKTLRSKLYTENIDILKIEAIYNKDLYTNV